MSLPSFLYDATKLRIALLTVAAVAALLAFVLHRLRLRRRGEDGSSPVILLNLDKPAAPATGAAAGPEIEAPAVPEAAPPAAFPETGYTVRTLQARPTALMDFARAALVVLALLVAAGFVLVIVPQRTVESMSQGLQARSGVTPPQEVIALLYLGDEVKDREFHVRGVVRNITTQPIEKLDASIRLYGSDGSLRETAIVRMDKETFAPDETAQFHLVYPNYDMQFASYSVDFKFRQDDLVAYKDMRGSRPQN